MTDKQKQHLLGYLGYYNGQIDGQWGRMSTEACRAFQVDYGLTPDGICGIMTQKMLVGAIAGTAEKVERTAEAEQEATENPKTGTWWDDIRYFKKSEFKCKCGGKYCNGYPADIDMNMVKIADQIRAKIGKPITINSGLRCKIHNANVGGVSNSQHILGKAADLGCPSGCTPAQMASIAESIMGNRGGIGIYTWGIHIDTRSEKSRWNG